MEFLHQLGGYTTNAFSMNKKQKESAKEAGSIPNYLKNERGGSEKKKKKKKKKDGDDDEDDEDDDDDDFDDDDFDDDALRRKKLNALLDTDDCEDREAVERDEDVKAEELKDRLEISEGLRAAEKTEHERRLFVAREQAKEFSLTVERDLEDVLGKIGRGEDAREMLRQIMEEARAFKSNASEETVVDTNTKKKKKKTDDDDGEEEEEEGEDEFDKVTDAMNIDNETDTTTNSKSMNAVEVGMRKLEDAKNTARGESFLERAKYIPLRLEHEERKLLRLLEAALHVSEYTDVVDVLTYKSKTQRIARMIKEICAIMSGLVVASDYRQGQKLILDREFKDNAKFFAQIFEIGRRHKIMNPEKMRNEYGKMVYLLQDSQSPEVADMLSFKLVKSLKTAYALLENTEKGLELLNDPLMSLATAEIMHEGKQRHDVQKEIRQKERARETLAKKYASKDLSGEQILHVLYSIADNNAYLRYNRDPVDEMLKFLTEMFDPKIAEDGFSLGISTGMNGARLSHNHSRQYAYVSQSLMLWREVANDMFKLWYLAEQDLLRDGNRYQLTNTGQGLNRVQHAQKTGKCMHEILHRCQSKLGNWVGSSVIHLGDHNVPNALMFIDKYTQVARILAPVVLVIKELPKLASKNRELKKYIDDAFEGVESCQKLILTDFFRHGFDGSGADNFFDAGSCIDGRLTSAWNWCSKIEKKSYYPVFKLCGFSSFDSREQ